jgi:hypothetical protein
LVRFNPTQKLMANRRFGHDQISRGVNRRGNQIKPSRTNCLIEMSGFVIISAAGILDALAAACGRKL